nr:glycosyl hydrolase [Kineosporia babensis]
MAIGAPAPAQAAEVRGAEKKVKLGVFRGTSPGQVRAFGHWLDRDVQYVVDFSSRTTWNEIADPEHMLRTWQGQGYRMVYGVAMLPTRQSSSIRAGARGEYNHHYRRLAENLVAHGQGNAVIRLGWEFNLSSWKWHPRNSRDFKAYWRHVVRTMRSVPGAQNLKFDWNVNNGGKTDSRRFYPGNKYVDFIGVDVYDISWPHYPYPKNCGKTCRNNRQAAAWKLIRDQKYGLKFWSRFARSKNKPLTFPEWGAWRRFEDRKGGADNPYFISRMHAFIDDPKNRVAYHAYFDFDTAQGHHELRTLPNAGRRYRQLFGG